MILSDKDIKRFVKEGKIIIEPFEERNVGPCSIDVRLGHTFRIFKHGSNTHIDPSKPIDPSEYTEEIKVKDKYVIHPGDFVLGTTLERVKLPPDIVGMLEGRSSWGRLGIIIHSTAGYIDSGFEGTITLEISNIGKMPVALKPGMRIGQIAFHLLSSPSEVPYNIRPGSKYNNQKDAAPSLIYLDANI